MRNEVSDVPANGIVLSHARVSITMMNTPDGAWFRSFAAGRRNATRLVESQSTTRAQRVETLCPRGDRAPCAAYSSPRAMVNRRPSLRPNTSGKYISLATVGITRYSPGSVARNV